MATAAEEERGVGSLTPTPLDEPVPRLAQVERGRPAARGARPLEQPFGIAAHPERSLDPPVPGREGVLAADQAPREPSGDRDDAVELDAVHAAVAEVVKVERRRD